MTHWQLASAAQFWWVKQASEYAYEFIEKNNMIAVNNNFISWAFFEALVKRIFCAKNDKMNKY
jgi:hypothetical protein